MSGHYHYIQSEPGLWTVGTGTPRSQGGQDWEPESDWNSPEEAAKRVAILNGGTIVEESNRIDELEEKIKKLKTVIQSKEEENEILREALREIAHGPIGKSLAVKKIARKALGEEL